MKRPYRVWMILAVGLMLISSAAYAQPDCVPYCTYTPGGWGAPCNGQNPGCLRDNFFDTVFPLDLEMGGGFTVTFTSAEAVENFYPEGGTPHELTQNHVDPIFTEAGVFGGHMLALTLNVGFGDAGAGGLVDIGDLVIATGPFAGYTVDQLLALGNTVLGGDLGALPVGTTISDLNTAVANVNNEFDNCTDGTGFIEAVPVVIVREYGVPLPPEIPFCLDFTDAPCMRLVWWCPFCQSGDIAIFTECDPGQNVCDQNCPPIAEPLSWGNQHLDSMDATSGCWWSVVVYSSEAGCACLSFDWQLAVNLMDFTAVPGNGQVQLDWATASERDNARFDIQRSATNSEWTTVGSVEGQGTSAITTHYSYVDRTVTNNTPYEYRLVSVDIVGNSRPVGNEVMATPSVGAAAPHEFALHPNYPNPFNPSTQIRFDIAEASHVTLKVFDVMGRELATLVDGELAANRYEVTFDANSLSSGTYFYRLRAGSFTALHKMLFMK